MTVATTPPRILTQDIAKGLAIFAVVYVHVWRGLVSTEVFPATHPLQILEIAGVFTSVALFFALAGYNSFSSLQRMAPKDFAIKRTLAILPIYVFWSAAQEAVRLLKHTADPHSVAADAGASNAELIHNILAIPYMPIGQFWFLYALMIYHILAAVLHKRPRLLLAIGAAAYFLNPLLDNGSMRALCYGGIFYAGAYLLAAMKAIPHFTARQMWVLAPICLVLTSVGLYFAWTHHSHPEDPLLLPIILTGTTFLMFACHGLAQTKAGPALAYAGRASLAIFVLHVFFFAGWRFLMMKLHVDGAYLHLISGTAVGILGPIAAYALLKRFNLLRYMLLG